MSRSAPRLFRSQQSALLLGLRLFLAADLARLVVHRWHSLGPSLQMLAVEGFPAPRLWLTTALLAGGMGAVTLLLGWRVRWGAALTLLFFMPVLMIFSVSYVPTGPPWAGTTLVLLVLLENLFLGGALMALFLFGAGRYTLAHGVRAGGQRLCSWLPRVDLERMSGSPPKQTASR